MAEQNPTVVATDDPALAEQLSFSAYDADAGQYVAPAAAGGTEDEETVDEPGEVEAGDESAVVDEPSEQPESPAFS